MTDIIYKIVPATLWRASEPTGSFAGAPVDVADGFIHFSTAAQVRETVALHFAGVPDLLLVAVDRPSVADHVRWEPSRGGDLFPHLYAPLPHAAVRWVRPLPLDALGHHQFPSMDDT